MCAEAIAVQQVLAADDVAVAEVGDPEVGVEAGGKIALARQPEPPPDVGRGDGGDVGFVQPVVREQKLPRREAVELMVALADRAVRT